MHLYNVSLASSTVQIATHRVETSWEWYVIRAAGFVAVGLLVLLMISGIGQVTGLTYRFIEPVKAWMLHKALAFALCASIAVHVLFLLLDHFVPFSLLQVLVPFQSHYNNGTTVLGIPIGWAVSFGIMAMYGTVILVLSSLGWIDTKKGVWRKLHYLSYLVIFLVFVHALGTGSDLKYGTFRSVFLLLGFLVVLAVAGRLWRAGTLRKTAKPAKRSSRTEE